MNDLLIHKKEVYQRIDNLKKKLIKYNFDAALILQNADLFYFSGTIQKSCLYIPVDGDPLLLAIKSFSRALKETQIDNVVKIKTYKQVKEIIKSNGLKIPKNLGMELDVIPTNLFFSFKEQFNSSIIIDISKLIKQIRSIKSEYEINIIQKAGDKSDKLARFAEKTIYPGVTEFELAGIIESEARRIGHDHIIRMRTWGGEICYGSLMSGKSAAIPGYLQSPNGGAGVSPSVGHGPSHNKIGINEPILFDYSFVYKGYVSDQTRIFCIGELPKYLKQAHNTVLELEEKIREKIKPGITGEEIYNYAKNFIKKSGYEDNFMGYGSDKVKFMGHGVGLEVDEYPTIGKNQTSILEENMTLALEPKLIFENEGVVGIENTYLLTEQGLKNLHTFPPHVCNISFLNN